MKKYKSSLGSVLKIPQGEIISRQIEFKEFDLPNKLHCILYKDNNNPIVNVTLGYKVGSKDEQEKKKGIAHLFEHMMFQGSDNVKKNEHFQYVMESGGTCNAFTTQDATVYYDLVPSNNLEMGLWLESERMNSLDVTDENLSNQKKVVLEEKMQRYDNAPYGMMITDTFANVFKESNYESSVIGEVEDINSFTVNEAKEFHSNYYSPENSVLIVSGDINYDESEELIYKYFANIKKENSIERKKNMIKDIAEDISLEVYDNIHLPMLNICFGIPKSGSNEHYTFDYFTEIIANNKSSRLYNKMVYEKKILKSIKALKLMLEDGGILVLQAMINPGVKVSEVKEEILNAVREFAEKGCTEQEFEMISNHLEFHNTAKHLKLQNIALDAVFDYLYFKDVKRANDEIKKYLSVTKQDVINSVSDFMIEKNKFTLTYLPMNYKK